MQGDARNPVFDEKAPRDQARYDQPHYDQPFYDQLLYDQSGLERLGAELARTLHPGHAVLLSGPLGAGKTTFARALLRAACGNAGMEVPSPSYTLVQSYTAPGLLLHHFDLWRLDGPDGLAELGWDDARAGVVIVEWPDRLGGLVPVDALLVTFAPAGEMHRRVAVQDGRQAVGS